MFPIETFLFIFYFILGAHGLQRFAEQPKYTEVNPGEDALLSCKIIDKRGSCSWQKDNKVSSTKWQWNIKLQYINQFIKCIHTSSKHNWAFNCCYCVHSLQFSKLLVLFQSRNSKLFQNKPNLSGDTVIV